MSCEGMRYMFATFTKRAAGESGSRVRSDYREVVFDKTFADHFPQYRRAFGHEPAVAGLVAGALAAGFIGQHHFASDHGGLFGARINHSELALGLAEVGVTGSGSCRERWVKYV